MEEAQLTLLRHQGDTIIVTDAPFGRHYVTARAQQIGPGIQVTPIVPTPAGAAASAPAGPAVEAAEVAPDTIALDDARRAAVVAVIEASENVKPEKGEQYFEGLSRPEVPRATVEKFEAMIAEGQ